MPDFSLDVTAQVQAQVVERIGATTSKAHRKLAQGIRCGSFSLAFSFDWARQIVDQFDLVPIPRAPAWVLGAVNVNGLILTVVDLSTYFSETAVPAQLLRGQRLLVGGVQDEDTDGALAVVFSQIPTQLDYETRSWPDLLALPMRLQEVCSGAASDDQGQAYIEIDVQRLMDSLSAELSVI
jgi:chemotaxis signal transduction protein